MKVLALDFDGVVCDSLREVFATALAAYEAMDPNSTLVAGLRFRHGEGRWHTVDFAGDPVRRAFETLLPLGNRAEDFGVSLRAIEASVELGGQEAYDAYYAALGAEWMAAFHDRFYEQRDAARTADLEEWLALHAPYPAFSALLRRRAGDARLAVATAKDLRSARLLLDHLGVGDLFDPELVLDKETGTNKTAHLTAIRDRLGLPCQAITFVDDKVNHLVRVAPLGVRPVLAAWGFNSDREHVLARELGFSVANISDAEAVLYGGGRHGG